MANKGRDLTIGIGTDGSEVTIAGVRTKSFTVNNEPIDVTNDDDDGWRDLLAEAGQTGIDLSVEGVVESDALRDLIADPSSIGTYVLVTFPVITEGNTAGTLEGDAVIASYQETGEYNGAVTFTLELQSRGAWTYTAEATP